MKKTDLVIKISMMIGIFLVVAFWSVEVEPLLTVLAGLIVMMSVATSFAHYRAVIKAEKATEV